MVYFSIFLSVAVQSTQYFANNGGSIKLTCVSSTTDLIEVYWVRTLSSNGVVQRLYSYTSARYTGITKEDPSVTINSINIGDAGEYVCHVRSRSGAEANSDSVNVNVIRKLYMNFFSSEWSTVIQSFVYYTRTLSYEQAPFS